MLLAHARTIAQEQIYRTSKPDVKFGKRDPVADAADRAAEDWEPVIPEYVRPVPPEDCGCGPAVEKAKK